MAGHALPEYNLKEKYVYGSPQKKTAIGLIGGGLVLFIVGIILLAMGIGTAHHEDGVHHDDGGHASVTAQHESHVLPVSNLQDETHDDDGSHYHAEDEGHQHGEADIAGHADAPANGHGDLHGEGHSDHGKSWVARIWANLWLNGVFFTGIALIGVFFVAVQYVAWAGWSTTILRVPLSFGSFLPIGAGILILTFIVGNHDLFHWTHSYLVDPESSQYDKLIDDKSIYLNVPFFMARMVIFLGLWILMYFLIRKKAVQEDEEKKDGRFLAYNKSISLSAVFIVIFAVTSSMAAWDWVMSIDPHWFSTLFGWYMFASWFVTGLAVITLVIVLLKEQGYMAYVNANHLHDMGKFMFAFSVFWTYLWFAQFLLYYYANIPEETIYFLIRMEYFGGMYKPLQFFILFINFVFPFLFLMTRESKRFPLFLKIAALAIIVGHWLDFYLMIMPGALEEQSGFGLIEFGTVALFTGLFMFVTATSLSKLNLVPVNHPMLEESLHHDI